MTETTLALGEPTVWLGVGWGRKTTDQEINLRLGSECEPRAGRDLVWFAAVSVSRIALNKDVLK